MLTSERGQRIYWLDNLRTFMVFLVVLIHAAVVYEKNGMGTLWWIISDPSTSDLPGMVFLILNIFVIATLFFISGYVTPQSLKHKNGWEFLSSKIKRLIIPWMISVLTLIPLYKIIFLYSRTIPQEGWTTYFHWNAMWSQNWLWFLPVLFLFNLLYLGLSRLQVTLSHITLKQAMGAILLMCFLYSVCMDYFNLHGWTKTVLIDFQNERLLIYFLMFLLGALCYHRKVFVSESNTKKLSILLHSTGWIPLNLYFFLLIYSLMNPGNYLVSKLVHTALLRLTFTLSLAYLLYTVITTFRTYLNRQGPISKTLSKNSYYVYIIHVIVMGVIAASMLNTTIPSPVKLLLLTVSTFGVSHVIVCFYKKCMMPKVFSHGDRRICPRIAEMLK
jgi:surface polysaccharide O-acyltransferase-like enzyme